MFLTARKAVTDEEQTVIHPDTIKADIKNYRAVDETMRLENRGLLWFLKSCLYNDITAGLLELRPSELERERDDSYDSSTKFLTKLRSNSLF